MQTPAELVADLEGGEPGTTGTEERFGGYGVMACPFASGHILAMRRFPITFDGKPYTSVWHRDSDGRWVFYQTQPPTGGCSRYFGPSISETVQCNIEVEWTGPHAFVLKIDGGAKLKWVVELQSTPTTSLLSRVGAMMPDGWWESPRVLGMLGTVAGPALGAGKLQLAGTAPNGQPFVANPKQLWTIPVSTAEVDGQDLGPVGPVSDQSQLGDFWVPNTGIFAVGGAKFSKG